MERFGEPGIQPITLVYMGKEMHEHWAAKFSSEILQKVHLLIWKPPQLPYSKVYVVVNVAVIRDLNVNFVAAKVEVIVGQCCLEAHFAGFWHCPTIV